MLLLFLTILCLACLLILFLMMPGESTLEMRAPFWGMNIAHRGLHTKDKAVPENSLAAFTAAVDEGYGIELDLQLTHDGRVVVFHDDDMQRLCGTPGKISDFTLEQLGQFTLHATDQKIPTLREVLAVVGGKVPLVIELKTCKNYRELCEGAWRVLRGYDGDICIESFDPRMVRWYKKNVPGVLRGQLVGKPDRYANIGLDLISWGLSHFLGRPHFIACQKGYRPPLIRLSWRFAMSVVWTVRPEDDSTQMELDYDAVIFEFYEPDARYMQLPKDPDRSGYDPLKYDPPYP